MAMALALTPTDRLPGAGLPGGKGTERRKRGGEGRSRTLGGRTFRNPRIENAVVRRPADDLIGQRLALSISSARPVVAFSALPAFVHGAGDGQAGRTSTLSLEAALGCDAMHALVAAATTALRHHDGRPPTWVMPLHTDQLSSGPPSTVASSSIHYGCSALSAVAGPRTAMLLGWSWRTLFLTSNAQSRCGVECPSVSGPSVAPFVPSPVLDAVREACQLVWANSRPASDMFCRSAYRGRCIRTAALEQAANPVVHILAPLIANHSLAFGRAYRVGARLLTASHTRTRYRPDRASAALSSRASSSAALQSRRSRETLLPESS
ncbi:hypothetical protein ANO11243_063970 [Dothideomycetidae sp. 11243]|nr:hypothetical protein ANO11243_063970 [fungal sp. No.11243]